MGKMMPTLSEDRFCYAAPTSFVRRFVSSMLPTFASHIRYHLVGLVVRASTLQEADLMFESHLRQDISRLSHTSDLNNGTPVTTLPGAWHYRVSAGTGWPSVSIL